jgi:fatty acid desaturase
MSEGAGEVEGEGSRGERRAADAAVASPAADGDLGRHDDLLVFDHRHGGRALAFVAIYLAAATTATALASHLDGVQFLALTPLYLLAAAALHGLSLFTHEGVHGSLARHRGWNHALSALAAWPVLQNFAAYRVLHLKHHRHLGAPGDPDHYANYTSLPPLEKAMHVGRLIAGYPAYLLAIPVLAYVQGSRWDRLFLTLEVLAEIGLVALALRFVPTPWLVHGWLVPMLFINTMVNVRGMSQHTLLEDATHEVRGSRTILTNRLTTFFMCNENYHLEHHLFPRVPWYHLPTLHQRLRTKLDASDAVFIPSYSFFVTQFVRATLRGRKLPSTSPTAS